MTNHRMLAGILLLASAGFVACSDDDGTGPDEVTLADLAGSYEAQAFTYTPDDDPSGAINLILAGVTVSVNLQASGAFTGLLNAPPLTNTPDDVPIAGTLVLTGNNTAEVNFDAQTMLLFSDLDISYEYDGENFVWTDTDVSFDFSLMNDPDNAEAAVLTVVLVRTT